MVEPVVARRRQVSLPGSTGVSWDHLRRVTLTQRARSGLIGFFEIDLHVFCTVYRYMLDQILLANVNNDPQPLDTVIVLLTALKSGWEEAVTSQRKNVALGGA